MPIFTCSTVFRDNKKSTPDKSVLFLLFIADKLGTPKEKVRLLKHLILSHHGKPEHGAAVVPVCLEAELLSCIDMLDSRVEIYSEATANLSPGELSPRIYALEKQIYKHQ